MSGRKLRYFDIFFSANEYRQDFPDIYKQSENVRHALKATERFKMLLTMIRGEE